MAKKAKSHNLSLLTIDEATAHGLIPLTMANSPDTSLRVGDGTCRLSYIEWLAKEQERITQAGDRQAEIVEEGDRRVALWVDAVVPG